MCRANGPQGGWGPLCSDPHCTHGTVKTKDKRETETTPTIAFSSSICPANNMCSIDSLGVIWVGCSLGGGGGLGIGPLYEWLGWTEL